MYAAWLSHLFPDFLGGECEQRSHQAHQGVSDSIERSLCTAPRGGSSRGCVQAVLQDIEVDGTQIDCREIVNRVIDLVERKLVVPGSGAGDQIFRPNQNHWMRAPNL